MDLIWYDLAEEIYKYFSENGLSSYNGYAHRPNTIDTTKPITYYFQKINEGDIDVFDKNGTNANGNNQPFIEFSIVIITKPQDATDLTLKSANLTHFTVEKAIRNELYNYVKVNTDNINYPLHGCLQYINITSILPDPFLDGAQGQTMSTMNLTIEYNKIGE